MGFSIKVGTNLKCTDKTGSYYLYEGDKVICHAGGKTYNGVISSIAAYKENEDSMPQYFILLDTFISKTSMERNIVKVNDITYIRKNPFDTNEKIYSTEQDILDALIEKGYNQEQAKAIYDRVSDSTMFYFIPYTKAMAYAIEAVKNIADDKNSDKDMINKLAKQCAEEAEKEYLELVEMYSQAIDRDAACFKDTTSIASKCWMI